MNLDPLKRSDITVILIDHAVGFANILGSGDLSLHINNVIGLARLATTFKTGLAVTNGLPSEPSRSLNQHLMHEHAPSIAMGAAVYFAAQTAARRADIQSSGAIS